MRAFQTFLIAILALTAGLSLYGEPSIEAPQAVNGILDLSDWNFEESGAVNLYGEWMFNWNEFIPPSALSSPDNTALIEIPSYWNNFSYQNKILPGNGFVTYRLKIVLPDKNIPMALDLNYINTAYKLYIDTNLIASAGIPGKSPETTKPYFKHIISFINTEKRSIMLTIHVSNYNLAKGGLWEKITLGDAGTINRNSENRLAFEIFIISSIILMGIYHIGIFFYRKSDKTALYFGLFCILIAIRALTTGELFITRLFPGIPWPFLVKLEYFCFYAAVPLFLMYIHSLFPKDTNKVFIRIFQATACLFAIQVILMPPLFFNKTLIVYQLITVVAGLYSIYILIRAVFLKRSNSLLLLIGFLAMFLAVINDLLHSNEIIHTGLFLPVGLFLFIVSQAVLILNHSAITYNTIEKQKNELTTSHDLFVRSRKGTILGLAKLSEYRDKDTGSHLERIREYCKLIAEQLALRDDYKGYITSRYIEDLYQSAILHDIGKVGVPDAILLKEGKLEPHEFEIMKQHSKIGGDAILNIESKTNMKTFLTLGKEIAFYHHEKWDGSGYPEGLSGKNIPLSARITAVADVYDALTSERPYKQAFSHEKSRDIIIKGLGTHFDPEIVDIFIEVESEFMDIKTRLIDN